MEGTYRKAIKFYYYQAFSREENGMELLFNFPDWATTINDNNFLKTIMDLEECKWSIENIEYERGLEIWVCSFNRARDNNIPNIIKSHKDSRPITLADDEYLGERLHILFDEKKISLWYRTIAFL